MKSFLRKIDKVKLGAILGLILPVIAFVLFKEVKYPTKDYAQLFSFMKASADNRNELVIFPVLPNLVLFYFTNYQLNLNKFTQGLVFVTVLLAILVVASLLF